MTIALIRPDDWNFPLLVHVAGAMLLVGSLVTAAALLLLAWRGDSPGLIRLGFRTLLIAAFPSYVLMRVGAEWINSKENIPDEADWIGIGYITADGGLALPSDLDDPGRGRSAPGGPSTRRRRHARAGRNGSDARRPGCVCRRSLGDDDEAQLTLRSVTLR